MNRKNPISPIKKGLDYEVAWGLYYCTKLLQYPDEYKWLWFETIPSESGSDKEFYLDDIVLAGQSNFYLYQIKHKQNPDNDLLGWDELLKRDRNSKGNLKDSLLQKWFKSFFKDYLRGQIEGAAFLTNGIANSEMGDFIRIDKINIRKIKKDVPDLYLKIQEQLGDDDDIVLFFDKFCFKFNQRNVDDLEAHTKNIFINILGATKAGVDNLHHKIHEECRKARTSPIHPEKIREWCEFYKPRPLDEDFMVPEDFEFFNKTQHEEILEDVQNSDGGIKVIYGKPGSGKSTYLSALCQILKQKEIKVIRHHYHISLNDPESLERLQSQRVEEAIKAELKNYPQEILGDLYKKDFLSTPLREFINQISQYFYKQKKSFVLIIDGLDHVLRYVDGTEVKNLLSKICFPQAGFWIILGTQESAKKFLPQIVFDKCPEKNWIEIKGLNQEALNIIVGRNIIGLNLPDNRDLIHELNEKLFELTSGNPLLLRYNLNQLKTSLNNQVVTIYECHNLIPYSGNIARYYDSLWRQLAELGRTILFTVASVEFNFKQEQLLDFIATLENNPTKSNEGFKSVSHLLFNERRGLSIYHSSFEHFILSQDEFIQQKRNIKSAIKKWLENSDCENLKWAELRRVAYDLGDYESIMELDKNWLIDAICFPREAGKIISQLKLGAKAAFESKLLGKVFELANLCSYYQNTFEFIEEASEKIWEEAFKKNNIDILILQRHFFTDNQDEFMYHGFSKGE